MPAPCSSSVRSVMWKRSSRWRSRTSRPGRTAFRKRGSHLRIAQNLANAGGQACPAFLFFSELFAAERRKRIEARLSIFLSHAPFSAHPTSLLHAMQRRIQRSLFNAQELIGNKMDMGGNGVAVHTLLSGECF